MVKEYKIKVVETLIDKIKKGKHFVFTEYKGLDMGRITELRRKLNNANSELKVVKNRLARLAYKKLELNLQDEWFKGPVALVICKDEDFVKTVNVVCNFSKENERFIIRLGYLENKVYNIDELKKISLLPTKKELIAKIMGILNSPITKFVFVLKNIVAKPVLVLKAIEDKKSKG